MNLIKLVRLNAKGYQSVTHQLLINQILHIFYIMNNNLLTKSPIAKPKNA